MSTTSAPPEKYLYDPRLAGTVLVLHLCGGKEGGRATSKLRCPGGPSQPSSQERREFISTIPLRIGIQDPVDSI